MRPDGTSTLRVEYAAEEGARKLRTTGLDRTSVGLAWTAAPDSRFELRRTTGAPATLLSQGVDIATTGTTAVDAGLEPGTEYTYSLFTQKNSRWYGPLVVKASTAAPAGSTDASYVAAPTTLLAAPRDITAATPNGSGVDLRLAAHVPTPLLGSAVVLPVSESLQGGFLGVITSLAPDGRTVQLTAGGLADAFDYYDLDISSFSAGAPAAAAAPAVASAAAPGPRVPWTTPPAAPAESEAVAASAIGPVLAACSKGAGGQEIGFDPGLQAAGHFSTTVDKYGAGPVEVPVSATVDMGVAVTVSGAASIKTSLEYECSPNIDPLFKPLSFTPVPISVYLAPVASVTVGGARQIENVGLTATAGVEIDGTLSAKEASFEGDVIANATPLQPKVTMNGSVGLKLGGELIVGPGTGTTQAGVIAGLHGELLALDAKFDAAFPVDDPRYDLCTELQASYGLDLALTAKAWLGKFTVNHKIPLEALSAKDDFFEPVYLPNGCDKLADPKPEDSVIGENVTKIGDTTTGKTEQWGHVDGFAPGTSSWVLSTGKISDATGTPGQFASSYLGGSGDPSLSALAGGATYDAASYSVTVVPTGTVLKVKYVFASEEYPEYVNSPFNDVMAVRVDGVNCAMVPGTEQAVAINTVNHLTNSAYYVDNSKGAAGYSTKMDGLTVPLTCSVPVTPGQPVTVQISIADTADGIYDSAVALVDSGIWSE